MRRGLLTALAILATAGPARAQAPEFEERTTPGWVFTPSVTFGGQWDTNPTVENAGNEPHFREWSALVRPVGDLNFNGRRSRMNLGYSGALSTYRHLPELRRYEQYTKFGVDHEFSRRLSLESTASYADVPSTDRLEILVGQLAFQDIGSRLFDATETIKISTSARDRIVAAYKFRHVTFDNEPQQASDSPQLVGGYSHKPSVTIFHDLDSRLTVGGGWDYRRDFVDQGRQIFDVHSVSGVVAYRLVRDTTVTAGLGAARLRETHGTFAKWGPTLYGALEQTAGRSTFSVRYERAFLPTYTIGGLTADQTLQVAARTPLGRSRSYVEGSVAYGRTRPVRELGLGFQLDSIFTHAAVGYRLTRWLNTEAFYWGMNQTSSQLLDVDRTRIGVQFVTFKPMRIQ